MHSLRLSGLSFVGLVCLALASALLYLPVFQWLFLKMSLANGYLHLFALLGLAGLGVYRLWQLPVLPFHFPVLFHRGVLIWLPASVLYLWNEANIGFHTLSAVLFIVFLFGLAGHFLSTVRWHSLLLPMLLLILVLPFEHYLDVYLGFPLRLLSAEMARSLLQITHLPMMTVESILLVDNRAAIVDLDCSGINSLWTGLIFYLLLTWVERFAIGWRWVVAGLGFMGLLVLANVFRIVILVTLDLLLKQPELAQLFHQSLGLLGFAISCLLIWWLLPRFVGRQAKQPAENPIKPLTRPLTPWLFFGVIALLAATYQPYQAEVIKANIPRSHALQLPAEYAMTATPLNAQERDFFTANHAQVVKYSLQLNNHNSPNPALKASLVMVWSRAWKTHHIPDNCYLSQGYTLSSKGVWQIMPRFNLRYLALNKPVPGDKGLTSLSSTYWFQSAAQTTPDYSARVLDNLFHPGRQWVMVSILWDRPVTPAEIRPFISTLKRAIERQYHEVTQ